MTTLKIATWNVNSLRARLSHVVEWLQSHQPDVLALQEIKVTQEDFPLDAIKAAGYHATISGQKSYNGVAVLTKQPPHTCVADIPGVEDAQRRVLCTVVDDVAILNLYVPNGESIVSPKFQYKLDWLQKLDNYLKTDLKKHEKLVLLGDFNIAPDHIDVHDPSKWEGQVLFSQPERNAFQTILEHGFVDCFRHLHPEAQMFSWWDYRMNSFKRNIGLRIDHILASNALIEKVSSCYIDSTPRGWERPSDHAPVVAEFYV